MTSLDNSELLEKALEEFAIKGFEGTSVRNLCRKINVSHNYVVQKYGSKDRLWEMSVDFGFKNLATRLAEAVNAAPKDPLIRLKTVLCQYIVVMAENPSIIQIINQESTVNSRRLNFIYDNYVGPIHLLADGYIRNLVSQGLIRYISPIELHFLIGHGAGGIVSQVHLSKRFIPEGDLNEFALDAVKIVFNSILL